MSSGGARTAMDEVTEYLKTADDREAFMLGRALVQNPGVLDLRKMTLQEKQRTLALYEGMVAGLKEELAGVDIRSN